MNFADLYQKPSLSNPLSEEGLIACCLWDPAKMPEAAGITGGAAAFYDERNAAVWAVMAEVYRESNDLDIDVLLARIHPLGPDTIDHFTRVAAKAFTGATSVTHARAVRANYAKRELITLANRMVEDVYAAGVSRYDEPHEPVADVLDRALDRIATLRRVGGDETVVSLAAADQDLLTQLGDRSTAQLPVGVATFDDNTGGLPPQGLYTIYGYTSSGKTTLSLQFAGSVALVHGFWVLVFSYEQPCRRVAATMLSAGSGVNVHSLMSRGELPTDADRAKLEAVMGQHAGLRFGIVEENLNAADIYAKCAIWKSKLGPRGCVIVDYVQNLPPIAGIIEDTPRINESMRWLQRTARDLDLLVLAVSQVNRAGGTADRPPRITDALGGVAIEARSDCIAAVYRPYLMEACPVEPMEIASWKERQALTQVHLLKSKYGPRGMAEMLFRPSAMRFEAAGQNTSDGSCPPF